jgi:IS5 family transposase
MIPGGERGGQPPYPDRDRGADLILKRLGGSTAFPTSRSNTNSRIAWATKFLWVDGLGRHSAPQCGLGVRERPWTSSHAGLFGGAQEQLASAWQYRPCGQIIDATLVLAPKQYFTKEEKDIVEQGAMPSDRSPTKRPTEGPGRLLVNKRYNLIRRLETVMPPPHDSQHFDAGLDRANTSREVYAGKGYASQERKKALREAGYRDRLQRKTTRAPRGAVNSGLWL